MYAKIKAQPKTILQLSSEIPTADNQKSKFKDLKLKESHNDDTLDQYDVLLETYDLLSQLNGDVEQRVHLFNSFLHSLPPLAE